MRSGRVWGRIHIGDAARLSSMEELRATRGPGDVPGGSPSLLAGRLRLSVAARRLELLLDHELRGQLTLLHAAEAQAVDAVFYLRHLIQLRLLRTGRLGPVSFLVVPLDVTP
eukprot:s9100_g1.t1